MFFSTEQAFKQQLSKIHQQTKADTCSKNHRQSGSQFSLQPMAQNNLRNEQKIRVIVLAFQILTLCIY